MSRRPLAPLVAVLALAALVAGSGCAGPRRPARAPGLTWHREASGYDLPLALGPPVSRAEAEAAGAYYLARTGEDGRLVEVTRYGGGKVLFRHVYRWDAAGLLEARITGPDGRARPLLLRRGPSGRLERGDEAGAPRRSAGR